MSLDCVDISKILLENGDVVSTEDQDIGDDDDHTGVTALTSEQLQAIVEDAVGTAPTDYSFSATSGSSTITLPTLSDGDEFYLRITFTKGSDSFTQRYRFKK